MSKKYILALLAIGLLSVGCNKKNAQPTPGSAPAQPSQGALDNAKIPAPSPAAIPEQRSNALLGSFESDCSVGSVSITNGHVTNLYGSKRVLLLIEENSIKESTLWYKGAICDVSNNSDPATATALVAGDSWTYSVKQAGQVDGAPWQITYTGLNGDSMSVDDQAHLTDHDENSTKLQFDSDTAEIYHRVP